MSVHTDPFARAESTARAWLALVGRELGTDDRVLAHRVLRAWLHGVRDRLPVGPAVRFAAQLPVLLRGEFFDGWNPARVPVPGDVAEFCEQFAAEAGIHQSQVADAVTAVGAALDTSCSAGNLGHVLAALPHPLRTLLTPVAGEPVRTGEGNGR
ncbi:DUF2267 domain-containing protein [Amycolatopsis mongoliensis]|uniref:DUF2267 domain-containing protein n=1 Tax=Amycolatopsis mongoliensis TaxID=715475 RepID=A0A9Y2JNE8_9PSEU|nr:DUF2267 domain-containing protein [Amycolatopsis sp. 4-36]WIY00534.1 DUF2267 domain-containing protein [Amycolatopsis sp. 4-36]